MRDERRGPRNNRRSRRQRQKEERRDHWERIELEEKKLARLPSNHSFTEGSSGGCFWCGEVKNRHRTMIDVRDKIRKVVPVLTS